MRHESIPSHALDTLDSGPSSSRPCRVWRVTAPETPWEAQDGTAWCGRDRRLEAHGGGVANGHGDEMDLPLPRGVEPHAPRHASSRRLGSIPRFPALSSSSTPPGGAQKSHQSNGCQSPWRYIRGRQSRARSASPDGMSSPRGKGAAFASFFSLSLSPAAGCLLWGAYAVGDTGEPPVS